MTFAGRVFAAGAQRRGQRLREEERALEVQVHHLVPAALREFVERCAPGSAGVVDEDVQLRLARAVGRGQCAGAFQGGHVGRQRDAGPQRRQFGRGLVARGRLAGRNVDARAGLEEAGSDHASDTARTAGDQGRAALQGKEVVHGGAPVWGETGRQNPPAPQKTSANRVAPPSPG